MTSRQPSPAPASASGDERILTARLELQPVVEGDAEALAEVFSDQRMYRFTGGQPGTREDLRAAFARIQAGRANDRGGTAQRNWTVWRRADGQAVGMLQAMLRPCPGLALRRLEQAERQWRTLIRATTRKVQRRVEGAGRGEQLRQEDVVAGLASVLAAQRELSMCGNKAAIATEGYPSSERGRFSDNSVQLLSHAW